METSRVKLAKLKVPQLDQILMSHNIRPSGNKAAKVASVSQILQADDIAIADIPILEDDEDDDDVRAEINNLKSLVTQLSSSMQSVVSAVQQLSTNNAQNMNNLPSQQQQARPETRSVRMKEYTVRDVVEVLPEFDPLKKNMSSQQFIDKVSQLKQAYGWSDEIMTFAIQQRLKGQAKNWLDAHPVFMSLQAFEMAFLRDFPSSINVADCHKEMMKRKRKIGEPLMQYYYEMLSIGRRGKLDDLSIVTYIVEGIGDMQITKTLQAMRIMTCNDLLASLEGLSNKGSNVDTSTSVAKPVVKQEGTQNTPKGVKCFNCNDHGHIASKCPKPQRKPKCTKCGKIGHEATVCRSTVNVVSNIGKDKPRKPELQGICSPLIKKTYVHGKQLDAFIDTGSDHSLIAETKVPEKAIRETKCTVMQGFGGTIVRSNEVTTVDMLLDDYSVQAQLIIVEDAFMPYDILIGRDILCRNDCSINITDGIFHIRLLKTIMPKINDKINSEDKCDIEAMMDKYEDCFAEDIAKLGRCNFTDMEIKVTVDKPIVGKRYQVPLAQRPALSSIINKLLEHGIIRPSNSHHAAPVVLVKKSNGEDRMCVDFRALNAVTVKKQFPMPIIEEQLAKLNGNKYFTILDMTAGYYQIPLEEQSKSYTAFITPEGLYEHNVMPFGLVNAPMVFQEMMLTLIKGLKNQNKIIAYVDEVIIATETVNEGIKILEEFLQGVRKAGLTLRPSKCVILATSVTFLGHVIKGGQMHPGEVKTSAITNFPRPNNASEMRRFLGLTGFFRKFIPGYGIIAKPLTELLRKETEFKWKPEHEDAYTQLKEKLTSKPVLVLFNINTNHQVHTDASSIGLSGVMLQQEEDGWKPVQYYSRQCSAAESMYPSHELEVLAMVETLERFRLYLLGRKFELVTDCNAIATTKSSTQLKPRIARWWLRLQEFDFECIHRPGIKMPHVDTLSRAPYGRATEPTTVAENVLKIDSVQETLDWVAMIQMQDDNLAKIRAILKKDVIVDGSIYNQVRSDYVLDNNRLCHVSSEGPKIVVPNAIRWRVTKACHDDMGHFALEKTIQRISKHFWFPRMRRYVKSYILSCEECCINKVKGGKAQSELYVRDVLPIPYRHVYIDHMGPFIRSKKGNSFLLVVVCGFSKHVILKPVRNTKTEPVIRALEEIMSIFGQPLKITSDRGTAFTSKQFEQFINKHGIQHVKTAVRTPRANGQVERANKTVLSALKCLVKDHKEWDLQLNTIQWAMNSQQNSVTKFTPNELIFNYNPRDVSNNRLIQAIIDEEPQKVDVESKYAQALENIKNEQGKWKMRYDKKHSAPHKYKIGDLVLLENIVAATGQSKKLEAPYKGPYCVAKCLTYDRYVIESLSDDEGGRKYTGIHSADHIKPWCELKSFNDEDEESSGSDDDVGVAELSS